MIYYYYIFLSYFHVYIYVYLLDDYVLSMCVSLFASFILLIGTNVQIFLRLLEFDKRKKVWKRHKFYLEESKVRTKKINTARQQRQKHRFKHNQKERKKTERVRRSESNGNSMSVTCNEYNRFIYILHSFDFGRAIHKQKSFGRLEYFCVFDLSVLIVSFLLKWSVDYDVDMSESFNSSRTTFHITIETEEDWQQTHDFDVKWVKRLWVCSIRRFDYHTKQNRTSIYINHARSTVYNMVKLFLPRPMTTTTTKIEIITKNSTKNK